MSNSGPAPVPLVRVAHSCRQYTHAGALRFDSQQTQIKSGRGFVGRVKDMPLVWPTSGNIACEALQRDPFSR